MMSALKIYLAGPFFNERELACVERAEEILLSRGFSVFSPRLNEVRDRESCGAEQWSRETFENDRSHIAWADAVVMLYHGAYSDSGTAWEAGYAYAAGKPVIVVHLEDAESGSNLMVHEGCQTNITLEELEDYDFEKMPSKPYKGKMF